MFCEHVNAGKVGGGEGRRSTSTRCIEFDHFRNKNLRINLGKVNGERKFRRKNFLKSQCMQEESYARRSGIQQEETMKELEAFRCGQIEEYQKVQIKPEKVFRPKVENLNRRGPNFVE